MLSTEENPIADSDEGFTEEEKPITDSDEGFTPLPVWSFMQRAGRAGRPGLDDAGEVILFLSKWSGDSDKYLREEYYQG